MSGSWGGVYRTRGLSRDSEIVLLLLLLPALLLRLLHCALRPLLVAPATGLLLLLLDCGACRSSVQRETRVARAYKYII